MTLPTSARFTVKPGEDWSTREARWDRWVTDLASQGQMPYGIGPDGIDPVAYETPNGSPLDDDTAVAGPYIEVYLLTDLTD